MPFCTKCGTSVEGRFCPSCGNPMGAPAPSPVVPDAPPAVTPEPGAPPAYQGTAPAAKKSPWLWVLVGCFGLVVIVAAGMLAAGFFVAHKAKQAGLDTELMKRNPGLAAAKMVAALNPNVEVVSTDEDRGTITLREKSTGKKVTLNFEDVKNGRIVFKDDEGGEVAIQGNDKDGVTVQTKEGTMRAGSTWTPPAWLPTYPGAKVEGGSNVQSAASDGGVGSLTTTNSVDDVLKFYEDSLKGQGMQVTRQVVSGDGESKVGTLSAHDSDQKKNIGVTATAEGGATKIVLTYSVNKK